MPIDDRKAKLERAATIENAIREVLLRDWDPIGVADVRETQDEYDGYIGGVYRLLASGQNDEAIAAHLAAIQTDAMGLPRSPQDLIDVARRLRGINVKL
jgi:hypothetical protein